MVKQLRRGKPAVIGRMRESINFAGNLAGWLMAKIGYWQKIIEASFKMRPLAYRTHQVVVKFFFTTIPALKRL
jgi:hypothetical protein